MAKCANCKADAYYSVENPGAQHQAFCIDHLPKILNPEYLPHYVKRIADELAAKVENVASPKSSKKKVENTTVILDTTPVAVEPEAVVETPVETEPAAE